MRARLVSTPKKSQRRELEFRPVGFDSPYEEDKENRLEFDVPKINNDVTEQFSDIASSPFKEYSFNHYSQTVTRPTQPRKQNKLVADLSSIKELNERVHHLETDNLNLKIEVKKYRTICESIPRDTFQLMEEKQQVDQQLSQAYLEINTLRTEVTTLTTKIIQNQSDTKIQELQDYIGELKSQLKRQDETQHDERGIIENLKEQHADEIEDLRGLMGDRDYFIGKYRDELEEKEHAILDMQGQLDQKQSAIDDLRLNAFKLENEMNKKDHSIEVLESTVSDLKNTIEELRSSSHNELDHQLVAKEYTIKDLQDTVRTLEGTIRELEGTIKQLQSTEKEAHGQRQGSQSQLAQKEHVLNDLKEQLHRLKAQYARDKEAFAAEKEALYSEKRAMDRQEASLREQIRGLIKEPKDSYNIYEAQVASLHQSEEKLITMNKQLNTEIASLKDQLFHLTTTDGSSARVNTLQEKVKELNERLEFYESEYNKVSKSEEELRKKYEEIKQEFKVLEEDNIIMSSQLKSQSKPLFDDLDKINLERLQTNNQRLIDEVETLNKEISRVKKELSLERENNHEEELHLEIKRLRRRVELENDNEEYERLSGELKALKAELTRERVARETEKEVAKQRELDLQRGFDRARPLDRLYDERLEKQLKNDLYEVESKLRRLQVSHQEIELENDRLQSQIRALKANDGLGGRRDEERAREKLRRIEEERDAILEEKQMLKDYYNGRIEDLSKLASASTTASPAKELLNIQLRDSQKSINELNIKVNELHSERERLRIKIKSLEEELDKVSEANNVYENNEKVLKYEVEELEQRNQKTTEDYHKSLQQCRELTSDLYKYKTHQMGQYDRLNDQISQLHNQMANTHISDGQRESQLRDLAEKKLKYYRGLLYDFDLKAKDFGFMYKYVTSHQLENLKLPKKLTFKTVAQMVVCAVRMRKRGADARERRLVYAEAREVIGRLKRASG